MRIRPRMRNTPTVFVRPPSYYLPMAEEMLIGWTVSWDAWPVGATDKTKDSDNAWVSAVGNKAYMMPVSPWFYTNLPEYNKNWLWRGDDLWHIRWQQVLDIQPNFVEVGSDEGRVISIVLQSLIPYLIDTHLEWLRRIALHWPNRGCRSPIGGSQVRRWHAPRALAWSSPILYCGI